MRETPERLPYEPMDERQHAIDMVRELDVTKDGDVFDLIARLLRDKDRIEWLEDQSNGSPWVFRQSKNGRGARLHNTSGGGHDTARGAIDAARKADA